MLLSMKYLNEGNHICISSTTKEVNALVIKLFMFYFMYHIIDYLVVKVKIKKCF